MSVVARALPLLGVICMANCHWILPYEAATGAPDRSTGDRLLATPIDRGGGPVDLGRFDGSGDQLHDRRSNDVASIDSSQIGDVGSIDARSGILGDVNADGTVDSTDALIVKSCDEGIDTSKFCPMNCGDVNADGMVNLKDSSIIMDYDAGNVVLYPVGKPGCPSSVTPCPGCSP